MTDTDHHLAVRTPTFAPAAAQREVRTLVSLHAPLVQHERLVLLSWRLVGVKDFPALSRTG